MHCPQRPDRRVHPNFESSSSKTQAPTQLHSKSPNQNSGFASGQSTRRSPTPSKTHTPHKTNVQIHTQDFKNRPALYFEECQHLLPKGFPYSGNFFSWEEQQQSLYHTDSSEWCKDLDRGTPQFGSKFKRDSASLEVAGLPIQSLPRDAEKVERKAKQYGFPFTPDQSMVGIRAQTPAQTWKTRLMTQCAAYV